MAKETIRPAEFELTDKEKEQLKSGLEVTKDISPDGTLTIFPPGVSVISEEFREHTRSLIKDPKAVELFDVITFMIDSSVEG